jgi:phosphoribosylaminoimidazolecarboxamide formyltransferase/IMP cyclohydrolase
LGKLVTEGPWARDTFPRTFNTAVQQGTGPALRREPAPARGLLRRSDAKEASVATAKQLQGKELSYNNIADTDAALECVKSFVKPACVIVKHANPCGVAVVPDNEGGIGKAYDLAYATDTESAFGGIIAFNRELDADTAKAIVDRQFVEVIIAPSISAEATGHHRRQAKRARADLRRAARRPSALPAAGLQARQRRPAGAGSDQGMIKATDLKIVTKRAPTEAEIHDLIFAWKVAKYVKSNAIVYAKGRQTIGVGAGQMSRVNSARIAAIKAEHAGLQCRRGDGLGCLLPVPRRHRQCRQGWHCRVIQPGGSMRDAEVIAAADEHGMAMVFTGMRHFRH